MSLWQVEGEHNVSDKREHIGLGTLTGDHVSRESLSGSIVNAIIDDQDPRVVYGLASGYMGTTAHFTATRFTPDDSNNSHTTMSPAGAAAQATFNGTGLAILGSLNATSGNFQVYIDGVLTAGRVRILASLDNITYGSTPLNATDTTIYFVDVSTLNSINGTIMIGSELIHYVAKNAVTNTLTGCTRGYNGTTPAIHTWGEVAWQWDTVAGCYSAQPDAAFEAVMWYNPFLEPGTHKVTVVVTRDPISGNESFSFDGFMVGRLVGAMNIQLTTLSFGISATTNGSGNASFGTLNLRTGTKLVGVIGYNKVSGPNVPNLQVNPDSEGRPAFGFSGTPSTTYSLQIFITLLGETLA